MKLTCSALRCSVLEGSAISGTSDDAGADDVPGPECIPDAVLYVTVDDETFARMVGDLEHATEFSFDAHRGELQERGEIRRRDCPVVAGQDGRRRDGDRRDPCAEEGVHYDAIKLLHISLNARRREPLGV